MVSGGGLGFSECMLHIASAESRYMCNNEKKMEKAGLENRSVTQLFILQAHVIIYTKELVNKHGVGGRKRDTERGWAGERENSERCAIQYHMTSKARLCKGAGKGRRYKKGVLISANQTSHLFSLVCTAQTWMFPATVLWEDWILPMFLVYRLAALLGPRISSSSLT